MISVLIVNWNTRELLRACLASIALVREPQEVLVADNASADGSAEMVRTEFPAVRLFASEANRGYAAANNQLAAEATGDLLLFLNPDTELRTDSFAPLVKRLSEDPKIALVAPQLVSPDGSVQMSCRRFPEPWPLLKAMLGFGGKYRMSDFDHKTAREVDQPMATCWLVRREAWDQVGPLDEPFPIFFNDVDWCYRAKKAGWKIWFDPAAKVLHHGGASTRQVRKAMIWESHRSLLRYYDKHVKARTFPPLTWLLTGLIWTGAWVRAKGWHAGFGPVDHNR